MVRGMPSHSGPAGTLSSSPGGSACRHATARSWREADARTAAASWSSSQPPRAQVGCWIRRVQHVDPAIERAESCTDMTM